MQFDTDVLVWALRGHVEARQTIEQQVSRKLSIVTYMELLQGARDKRELNVVKRFLARAGFDTLPVTENVGHRALVYIEQYGLAAALGIADALIAATAVENAERLLTANVKHFKPIRELELVAFKP